MESIRIELKADGRTIEAYETWPTKEPVAVFNKAIAGVESREISTEEFENWITARVISFLAFAVRHDLPIVNKKELGRMPLMWLAKAIEDWQRRGCE